LISIDLTGNNKAMYKLDALNAVRMLSSITLPPPDFVASLAPEEVHHISAESVQNFTLAMLAPIGCKFSQKIAKKDGFLSISEGDVYLIARRGIDTWTTSTWRFEHESQLDELKKELIEGAVIGIQLPNGKMRVVFTAEDAEQLEIIEDKDLGWRQLVSLWVRDTINQYASYGFKEPVPYDAFFDTDVTVPVLGNQPHGQIMESLTAVEFFTNVMSKVFSQLERKIASLVRQDPYRFYTVELRSGGISIVRHGDVRAMLYERDREQREQQNADD